MDIFDKISGCDPEWPMMAFEYPSLTLWNSIAEGLSERGWSEDRIRKWLQSKDPGRWCDNTIGDALIDLGRKIAEDIAGY